MVKTKEAKTKLPEEERAEARSQELTREFAKLDAAEYDAKVVICYGAEKMRAALIENAALGYELHSFNLIMRPGIVDAQFVAIFERN